MGWKKSLSFQGRNSVRQQFRYLWRTSWTKPRVGGPQENQSGINNFEKSANQKFLQGFVYGTHVIFGTFTDFHTYCCIRYTSSILIFLMSGTGHGPALEYLLPLCSSRCWAPAWQHPEGKASGLAQSNGKMFQFADLNMNVLMYLFVHGSATIFLRLLLQNARREAHFLFVGSLLLQQCKILARSKLNTSNTTFFP